MLGLLQRQLFRTAVRMATGPNPSLKTLAEPGF